MKVGEKRFHELMRAIRATRADYKLIKGFFKETLKERKPTYYGIGQAAFVFLDCDLYESTSYALRFVGNILGHGCILAFDDWYCFSADPERGQRRAFDEFVRSKKKQYMVTTYLDFGWHGKSFIVHQRA